MRATDFFRVDVVRDPVGAYCVTRRMFTRESDVFGVPALPDFLLVLILDFRIGDLNGAIGAVVL